MPFRGPGKLFRSVVSKVDERVAQIFHAPRSTTPERAEVGGPLDAINDGFHESYEASRSEVRQEVPVFVVLADELIVFYRERTAWSFAPRTFHVIKSVSHAPLAIFANVQRGPRDELDAEARSQLETQRARLREALERMPQDAGELDAETQNDLRTVLKACLAFLSLPQTGAALERDLTKFARELGPVLLRLADAATQLQLDALHAHVETALQTLSPDERSKLQVVVAGDHQARARSLAMQYFERRLSEPEHVEHRVTYAEGVSDEQAALALVGTRKLDHAIGRAFFGEQYRLQRDILGDAAHARLQASELEPIE